MSSHLDSGRQHRTQLIADVWGGVLPTVGADVIEVAWNGVSLSGLAQTDRWTMTVFADYSATVWRFLPTAAWSGKTFVFIAGHGLSVITAGTAGTRNQEMLIDLLAAGHRVLGLSMPVYIPNEAPLTVTIDGQAYSFDTHDSMKVASPRGAKILRLFVDPAIRAINQELVIAPSTVFRATGCSGGGWTTDWLAALDTRIAKSYPVMGSMPQYMRRLTGGDSLGDWEQSPGFPPFLLSGLTFEELYVLALDGGRSRKWILGDTEPVFPTASLPAGMVNAHQATLALFGSHSTLVDTAALHEYTTAIRAAIIADA